MNVTFGESISSLGGLEPRKETRLVLGVIFLFDKL